MARWITVRGPFDYRWPGRSAITHFSKAHLGDHYVKDEVADFAVANGYADEGKSDPASRSSKGKKDRPARESYPEHTADLGAQPPVGDEGAARVDWPVDRPAVDPDAE